MDYRDFSSMPPEQERTFVAFERRTVEAGKKAWQFAYIAAAAFGVLTMIVVFSFDPPKNQHAEDLQNSMDAEQGLGSPPADRPDKPVPAATSDDGDDSGGEEGDDSGEAGEAGSESGAATTGEASGAAEAAAPAETGAGAEASGGAEAPPPPKGATKAPPTALVGDK